MRAKSVFVFLAAIAAALAAAGVAEGVEGVTLTTGDGAKLAARYYPGNQGSKSPAVMVLDDLAEDARPAVCDEVARRFSKEGCTVLCFDFRGCGQSRNVEPEFWEDANNKQLVKGYKADEPPEAIRFGDFKPGYLPTLVNDVAAARAYLERRNDARECNTGQVYVIGFGRGATLGQLWLTSEWSRYRVAGAQNKLATSPEGRNVAGCVWVGAKFSLDKYSVPMFDLLKKSEAKKSLLVGLVYESGDADGERFAKQCLQAFNSTGRKPLVATQAVTRDAGSLGGRAEVNEQIDKFVAHMRKIQELPPWDDRDFNDRRFVWAFRGAPLIQAKDEGEYHFLPVPVEQLLGKR